MRTVKCLVLVVAVLLATAGPAAAAAGYWGRIVNEMRESNSRVWSDPDRPDAFTAAELRAFDEKALWLGGLSKEQAANPNPLPGGLQLVVAQVDYNKAKKLTRDGYSWPDELEMAIRGQLGYKGSLLAVVVEGSDLKAEAYGDNLSPETLDLLDEIAEEVNEDAVNWADPVRLLRSYTDRLARQDWGAAQRSATPTPAATSVPPVATTAPATPPPATTTAPVRSPAESRGHQATGQLVALLLAFVCGMLAGGVLGWAAGHSSQRPSDPNHPSR